jgi:hypothetical protein
MSIIDVTKNMLIRWLTCPLDLFIEKNEKRKRDQSYKAHMFSPFEFVQVL